MVALERAFAEIRPALAVVYGDVNSTVAAALVAAKIGLPMAHVEAGLRSFDDTMPEEINRRVTDLLSELLFVTSPEGVDNLVGHRDAGAPDPLRRQPDDRHAADPSRAVRRRADADGAGPPRALCGGHHAPPVQRGRSGTGRPDRGDAAGRRRPPAADRAAPPTRPADARGGRAARRRPPAGRRSAGLRRLPVAGPRRRARRHRFGRHPGGDDDPECALPDGAAEHGTTRSRSATERTGSSMPMPSCRSPERSSMATSSCPTSRRRSGTVMPGSGSRTSSSRGSRAPRPTFPRRWAGRSRDRDRRRGYPSGNSTPSAVPVRRASPTRRVPRPDDDPFLEDP